MVVKNIIAEDMPFTKSIFEQFWRSYCKKTIFVVFHFLKFLPNCEYKEHAWFVVLFSVFKKLRIREYVNVLQANDFHRFPLFEIFALW